MIRFDVVEAGEDDEECDAVEDEDEKVGEGVDLDGAVEVLTGGLVRYGER